MTIGGIFKLLAFASLVLGIGGVALTVWNFWLYRHGIGIAGAGAAALCVVLAVINGRHAGWW